MSYYGKGGVNWDFIGGAIAYTQGGYEVDERVSRVGPGVEAVLMEAMGELLAV